MATAASHDTSRVANRWLIAAAGVVMQLALGAVYAWSVFRNPLRDEFGWSISQITLTFTISIFVLGATAYFGGLWMAKVGPRRVGITAGLLFGLGVFLAGFAGGKLWLLYLSYGLIAGTGLGFGYIVPVATLVKWFPDRRGMITGIAVTGFGGGALITAPIATRMIESMGVLPTFRILGIVYLVMVVGGAWFMRNPPEGYKPEGWEPSAALQEQRTVRSYTVAEALRTPQWWALWALLFLNVNAGIAILSQAAPMAEEITGVSAAVAAGLVGIISVANGSGRLIWAWLSDYVGRRWIFLIMFLVQAVLFFLLGSVSSFALFTIIAFVILTCYGGGFGTMPAFTADYFGPKNVGQVYGLMLTAWGVAGITGPLFIANIRETTDSYSRALYVIAAVMLVSAIVPFLARRPKPVEETQAQPASPAEAEA